MCPSARTELIRRRGRAVKAGCSPGSVVAGLTPGMEARDGGTWVGSRGTVGTPVEHTHTHTHTHTLKRADAIRV